jgi:hypothetical protein
MKKDLDLALKENEKLRKELDATTHQVVYSQLASYSQF